MVAELELLDAVDAAFESTGREPAQWPNPHPGRAPLQEEYSRLTNPAKWRIIGARADAWLHALAETSLAVVEPHAAVVWAEHPGVMVSRADRVVAHAPGAMPLVVTRDSFGGIDDAGVSLGVGDPTVCVAGLLMFGCDACDSGSDLELDQLDDYLISIVSGAFRGLTRGDRAITAWGPGSWSARGLRRRDDVDKILAYPRGWSELSGSSWLADARPRVPPAAAPTRPRRIPRPSTTLPVTP